MHRQKRSPYSLKSAQLTCRREHGVLIHYRPEHDNGHLFSEAAFRSCRLTGILAGLLWLWHRLETNAGCWLAHNGNNNKNKKHSEIYIFSLKMVLHVSYSTYHPNAPNLLRRQALSEVIPSGVPGRMIEWLLSVWHIAGWQVDTLKPSRESQQ